MTKYHALLFSSMLLASGAQILLKMGANRCSEKANVVSRLVHPLVILGLAAMAVSMLMNVRGLRYVPLKDMTFILPTIYIAVPLLAFLFLGEKLQKRTLIGSIVIVIGGIVFNLPV